MKRFAWILVLLTATPAWAGEVPDVSRAEAARNALERLRRTGDLHGQREHAWALFRALTMPGASVGASALEAWYGEDRVFAASESAAPPDGILGFVRLAPVGDASGEPDLQSTDTTPLSYTLYNEAAYRHIRRHRLFEQRTLEQLRLAALTSPSPMARDALGRASIPPFPRDAVVLKTAWWPARAHGLTPLPVWDPGLNPAVPQGNGLLGWKRIIAVDAGGKTETPPQQRISFAGALRTVSRRVAIGAFHSLVVSAPLATRLQQDPALRKVSLLALGRPLQAGDHLLLLGVHVATREIDDWTWSTLWWHDAAEEGPYADGRPRSLGDPWRNYLLDVAFDASLPAAADGGPHIAFNPWFEARFADGGHGGGTASNCMTCHRRASYPPAPFLPVTRGEPDLQHDAAFGSQQLATNQLWSLAMHARH